MIRDTPAGDRVVLLCSVRGCGEPLTRDGRSLTCPRRHSFDLARSGYVNLLQVLDRRSRRPGDSKEAVAARRRFLARGHAEPLVRAMSAMIGGGPILDAGCGEGHHLAAFRAASGAEAHGVDISVPAIDLAARTYRDCTFVVANADRFLPYADQSFAAITSITARLHAAEFRRVLKPDGILIVAVAAPDDLIELRGAILGEGKRIDRTESAVTTLESHFTLQRLESVRTIAHLDREAIADVMTSSYRAMRLRERERLETLGEMDVTLSRDVLVLGPRA
ncbi:MAG TPA: methyltransferase domain-containing protein [Thermoanaerobaculia bacterium]|nr:methyltransferase domain-containing protein [Thermoanaerobaculia bacterium]